MVVSRLRAQESLIQPIVFGKLPNRSDFVRINATQPVAHEFDELIQGALEQFRTQEGWDDRYDASPMVDICYTSRDKKWIFLGTMQASRDQSGRRYPLVAGVAFPSQSIAGERMLLPIACEVYFEGLREQLSNAIENSVEGIACRQFLETQTSLWMGGSSDMPLAAEIVRHFQDGQPPSVLESPLAKSDPSGTLIQALLNIAFYRDFLRRFSSPSAIQLIEIPLQGGRGEAALHACAWLNLLSALTGNDEPWNGGFLLRQGRDPEFARLFVTFGQMPDRVVLAALGGGAPDDGRLNLWAEQKTWQAHKMYAETAYAMDRLLLDPNISLSTLCTFLREASKKIAFVGY